MKVKPHNFQKDQACPHGCIFYCPCPDGCNGCEIPQEKWKLLGDCRAPGAKDCALNYRKEHKA